MEWLVPWHSIENNPAQVAAMEQELMREVGKGHPLQGLPVHALGRRQDCDDVLFAIEDGTGRVAVVHLTWSHGLPERPPWPNAVLYSSLTALMADGMHSDHIEFHA